jgi:protein-L-isoaspartate(D-aspartate) O-methyltransferase
MEQKRKLINFWLEKGVVQDERIISAFVNTPRETFLPEDLHEQAYEDHPLPTIRGQSLSQPTTVMIMTQALNVQEGEKIFEVGSGVGYQACILGNLAGNGEVFTTEIMPELVQFARENVTSVGLKNVQVIEKDGSRGLEMEAPFDKIMVTAACPKIPQPLIDQLKEGGIIVAPVGDMKEQTLVKATKLGERLDFEFLGPFLFVPMQGKHGFDSEISNIEPK